MVAGSTCRRCTRRGACLLCRLPTPPLASLSAPYPPDPLPRRGRGCPKVDFAGGFAPGTPALNRLRHLQSLPLLYPAGACPAGHPPDSAAAVPGGEMNPSSTCYPCPGGEDHLKRRSSSPPAPPLLGCRHCSRESLSVGFTSNLRLPRRRDGCMAGSISAVNGLTPGCRGRSPRRNKLIVSPFPVGEGGWGDRGKKKGEGRGNKRQTKQAPRRAPLTQVEPVPRPIQPRGCKGRSPLHKKTKNLPLPRRGRSLCERGLGG